MAKPSDRERWDARWASELGRVLRPPDPLAVEALRVVPQSGRAVDLACGTGRHALWLAGLGYQVEGWDVSPVGLAELASRARAFGRSVDTREVDLNGPLPDARFELALIVDFLERSLFARLAELVEPQGHAIVVTFDEDWPEAHPSARFRLRRAELAPGLPGFSTLRHWTVGGRAAWLGRRL